MAISDVYEVTIKQERQGMGHVKDVLKHCIHKECERPLDWKKTKEGHNAEFLTAWCRNCGSTYSATVIT